MRAPLIVLVEDCLIHAEFITHTTTSTSNVFFPQPSRFRAMTTLLKGPFFSRVLRHVERRQHMVKLLAALSTYTEHPNPHRRCPLANIDDTLSEDGYGPAQLKKGESCWGFALYRCAYADMYNSNWKRMLDLINAKVLQGLEAEERIDLLPSHQLSIIEDPTKLDGATSHQVREHFILWTQNELTRVLKDPSKRTCRMHGPNGIEHCPLESFMGTRYNFCLFVDEICLESLDETPSRPVVKILIRDWEKLAPEDYHSNIYSLCADHGYEDGITNDPDEDVGWMYLEVFDYVEWFNRFVEPWNWVDWYRRPPCLADYASLPGLNVILPGGWRKKRGLTV